MPLVQVNMLEGRTAEQKKALLQAITDAVHQTLGPVPSIRVWINELADDGFMIGGVMASERSGQPASVG
jgi:4-oxalocrotonate tautomerase